jgi:26S proteasome regulatory subunit N10
MLERALAMSLEGREEEQSTPAVPDFAHMTEEEQIAFAMQMSMQDARKSAWCFYYQLIHKTAKLLT